MAKGYQMYGKAKEALDRINTEIQNLEERKLSGTINEQMNEIAWRTEKMMYDAKIAGSEDYVAYKSRDNNVKIIQETAIGKVLENALTAQSTEESKARVKKMAEDITVNYMNAYTNKRNARYRDWETDRKSTRLNSSHRSLSRMPSSA